jgi:uncharacterized protein YbaR (Trm112 family)
MSVDAKLLAILRCPMSRKSLEVLSRPRLDRLNEQIRAGRVRYQDGSTVDAPLEEGLITEDGSVVYRVDEGIPVMLQEQAIPTEALPEF